MDRTHKTADLGRGQAFLADRDGVSAYRENHGSIALEMVVGDGGQFLVKHIDVKNVELISFSDLAESTVTREAFDTGYFTAYLDEMPLYWSPPSETIVAVNKDIEAHAMAASLCFL